MVGDCEGDESNERRVGSVERKTNELGEMGSRERERERETNDQRASLGFEQR